MSRLFRLSDEAWAAIEPHLPGNQPGARRVDDRRVISGIIHVVRTGCPWRQCPTDYGPPTTICNRFDRWSGKGVRKRIFETPVAGNRIPEALSMDAGCVKAHRSAHGAKGGPRRRPSAARGVAGPPRSTR
jgi:transposase